MSPAAPSPSPARRRARNVAPGTCGELAQGVLTDGTPFVVTCPIDRGTSIEVTLTPAPQLEIVGVPAGLDYLTRALRRAAELIELGPCRIEVEHHTALYVGKGMASSTADIVAGARALALAAGLPLRPDEVAELAAAIEPSDGIMYDGIVAADPRTGLRLRSWTWWPQYVVVMVIPPDTFMTSAACFDGQERLAGDYDALLSRLDDAVDRRDDEAFAREATRSALLGQEFVASEAFARLHPRAADFGAVGTCAGHTGTVAGLLFTRTREGHAAAAEAERVLRAELPVGHQVTTARTPDWPAQRPASTLGHRRRAGDSPTAPQPGER